MVIGEAVNVILCGERFPNRLRNDAYLELKGLISLADEVIPIPEEALERDIPTIHEFFKTNDYSVGMMDRLILAWVVSLQPDVFVTTDEHIINNEEMIGKEFQIRFKNPRRINRHA